METIQLIIDNKEVEVPRGTTILDAAKSVGIHKSAPLSAQTPSVI